MLRDRLDMNLILLGVNLFRFHNINLQTAEEVKSFL